MALIIYPMKPQWCLKQKGATKNYYLYTARSLSYKNVSTLLCENWKMRTFLRSGMELGITFTLCPLKSDHRLRTWLENHHFLPGYYCSYSVASALQKYRLYALDTGSSIFLLFSYFYVFAHASLLLMEFFNIMNV